MKAFTLFITSLCLLVLGHRAQSQDDRKLRNDPTYSTHNYKHPNKASTARRWEASTSVPVQQPAPGDANLANYKRQTPTQQPVGGITVEHTPSTDVANRNYKMQRPTITTPATATSGNTGIARKRQNRSEKAATAGQE